MGEQKREVDQIKAFLGGGCGGIANPFDTLKVRMQTAAPGQYSGMADCFRKTIAKDGLRALYRGVSAPLIGVTPMWALSFWSYDLGQRIVFAVTPSRKSKDMNMLEFAFAGGFSGLFTTIITTPMERVKVILQTQDQVKGGVKYKGMVDAGVGIFKEGGLGGLYRGTIATLARDIPGSAAYFVAYEFFYRLLKKEGQNISIGATLFAGGMSGVAMWSIAIPPDVIKSRIQAAPPGTYKGFVDCGLKMVRAEGANALFKGLGPALLRAFPANAAGFMGRAAGLEVMHQLW
ncbi:carnitine transporter [Physocladia obscura]|uniref:Carnitine transporter n=1 Tax=Physocladia obscura TaxID=109957 RepID=A0AAD5T3U0_9FUNG|nr:carnitine transporter [Physocladia obscura]